MGGSKSKSKKGDKDGGNPAHQPENKKQDEIEKEDDGSVEFGSHSDQNRRPKTSKPKNSKVKEKNEAPRPKPISLVSPKPPPENTPNFPVSFHKIIFHPSVLNILSL